MAMASPISYSQFTTSESELANQIKYSDNVRTSYSGGVGVAYKINKLLSVQSGVYFSSRGQDLGDVVAFSGYQKYNTGTDIEVRTANGAVVADPDVYITSDYIPTRVVTDSKPSTDFDPYRTGMKYLGNTQVQDISYLELPLLLRYKAIDKKVGVSVVGGLSSNFLVNSSVYAIVDGEKHSIGKSIGLDKLLLGSSLGMGMEYKFSQNFSFNVEPTLRYLFNSDKIAGLHTYSFGVFSGLSYKF
jgi:hypothetical protein